MLFSMKTINSSWKIIILLVTFEEALNLGRGYYFFLKKHFLALTEALKQLRSTF